MIRIPCPGQIGFQFSMPSVYAQIRSRLIRLAPASSAIWSIRPSTCAGTPASIVSGNSPRRSTGQYFFMRSKLWPIPPVVTMTAGARSSKSATSSRFDSTPRAVWLGASVRPRTPTTVPDSVRSVSTRCRNPNSTSPAVSAASTGSRKTRTTSGPVPQVRWKRGTELPCSAAPEPPRSAQPTIGVRRRPRSRRYCRFSPAANSR